MKPHYALLRQNYPRTDTRAVLFTELGWPDLVGNKAFLDTCAIRMSVALRLSRVPFQGGGMRAKAGKIKGALIQIRQADLSQSLKRLWGAPEVYKSEHEARDKIGIRKGVVSFFRIEGGNGGHIDLIAPAPNSFLDCARSCYFSAVTIWFWPLK